jgi:23S rRNA (pseudouridine1915-N3)-methyltransferase
MKLKFLFPGKTRESFLAEGVAGYFKRLQPLAEAQEHIVKAAAAAPADGPAGEARAREREADRILERCAPGEYVVALDIGGRMLSSAELAAKFETLRSSGVKAVDLVVGGPWGLGESVLARADLRLSLSPMTFSHELARLILLEQVYRAYAILNHLPYHK